MKVDFVPNTYVCVCEGCCSIRSLSHCHSVLQCGVTPDSENLTLSSSGAIDQSSCTGTPLSSTITSPEGTSTHHCMLVALVEHIILVSCQNIVVENMENTLTDTWKSTVESV